MTKLTQASVTKITVPEGRDEVRIFDQDLPGFALRVRAGGGRRWIAQYRDRVSGKSHTVVIGDAAIVSAAAARERAKTILAKAQLGDSPAQEKQAARDRAAESFGVFVERFLAHKAASARPAYLQQVEAHLTRHWEPFSHRSVHDIDRRAVATQLAEIGSTRGGIAANRAKSTLQGFYKYLQQQGVVEINPVVGAGRVIDEKPRDRLLSDEELKAILLAARDSGDFGYIVSILAHTGQRRCEVSDIARSEINQRTWTIPSARSKNGLAHEVWLSDPVLEILETVMAQPGREGREIIFGDGVAGFRGFSRAKIRLDQKIEEMTGRAPTPWHLHDVRRCVANGMARLGISLPVIEKVLNHVSGSFAGIVATYQRHSFAEEKKIALAAWSAHIERLIAGESASNVVRLQA